MSKVIEVNGLKKNYNGFTAVDGISFGIERGEIYGFLGPNGAGKTTTINMLTGMARVTGGKIMYNGKDLTCHIKKAQRIIGVVADESNLYDEMNGFENLAFCGSLYGLPKKVRTERAFKLLEEFNLGKAAKKDVRTYSKGMKRKLTIAAALIHQPEVLFLDEPTTGIDVASVRHIRTLIRKLNDRGTTIFLTTHYIEEAQRLCDRVAFIDKGKIICEDSVTNLIESIREVNTIEVVHAETELSQEALMKKLNDNFPEVQCTYSNHNALRIRSEEKLDISPIVAFLSAVNIFIYEAKLIKPTLEDAFVKATGIDLAEIKKEKEKK